jgi:beta-glucosidase
VLFLGDSITHRWLGSPDIWQKYYGRYDPADFGIEGDRTEHVLWRIAGGELDGIHPKVVVLLIGTNNIGYPVDDIVKGDTKVVSEIHSRLPDTKVLLLGIFPRGADPADPVRAKIKDVNAALAKLDDGGKTRFLDFGDRFLETDGSISKEMMPDALHPAPKGYQIWAGAMQPLLDEMMKP